LAIHVFQVHKENLTKVPNAKPGHDLLKYDICGMEGVPDEEDDENGTKDSKKQKIDSVPAGIPRNSFPTGMPTLTATPLSPFSVPTAPAFSSALQMPVQNVGSWGVPSTVSPSPFQTFPGNSALPGSFPIPYPLGMNPMISSGIPPMMSPTNYSSMPVSSPLVPPLFPIVSPSTMSSSSPSSIPSPSASNPSMSSQTGSNSSTKPSLQPVGLQQQLIFPEEHASMEEIRAELEKYRYEERSKDSQQDSSLEAFSQSAVTLAY